MEKNEPDMKKTQLGQTNTISKKSSNTDYGTRNNENRPFLPKFTAFGGTPVTSQQTLRNPFITFPIERYFPTTAEGVWIHQRM